MHQWIYPLLARSTRPPLLVNRRCGNVRAEILGFLIKNTNTNPLLTFITAISVVTLCFNLIWLWMNSYQHSPIKNAYICETTNYQFKLPIPCQVCGWSGYTAVIVEAIGRQRNKGQDAYVSEVKDTELALEGIEKIIFTHGLNVFLCFST